MDMCIVESIDRSGHFNRIAGTFRYQILADKPATDNHDMTDVPARGLAIPFAESTLRMPR